MICEVFILLLTVIFFAIGFKVKKALEAPPKPISIFEWWGPGQEVRVDQSIRPFKVDIQQEVLDDLKRRLDNARTFTPPLESIEQQYGMNTNLLSEIVEFWKTKYDWRERETFLNQFPQFKTNIQGLDIHFLHVKPTTTEGLKVVPLLLIHGWPGCVREFYELLPLLTNPRPGKDFIFEVIAPSLPGYGFSDAASKPGLHIIKMAFIFKNLMRRLGFNKYYVQGGDWGGMISSTMLTLYPENVQAAHVNFCAIRNVHPVAKIKMLIRGFLSSKFGCQTSQDRILKRAAHFQKYETGYYQLQASKPDTVGVALNDSPVGLAAYILEKYTTWTNLSWINRADGGLLEKYTYTKLLDIIMIYWVTSSITTSMRLYYERMAKASELEIVDRIPVTAPFAYVKFENEIWHLTDDVVKHKYFNLLHSPEISNVGHFAAFEEPEVLAKDIWLAFGKFLNFNKQ